VGYRFALFIACPLDKGAGIAVCRLVAFAVNRVVGKAKAYERDKRDE
jgi:hypothetical protein